MGALTEAEGQVTASTLYRLQGRSLGWYAGVVSRTARFQIAGAEHIPAVRTEQPTIIAAWHGLTMMITGYLSAQLDTSRFVVIVPDDQRGVVLENWARSWGAQAFTISMQEDSLLAARRLLALIRQLRPDSAVAGAAAPRAKDLYVNPDGPDGPSNEPKGGVLFIARKAKAPIVPAGAYTTTAFRVPRWDRYVVPLPYSRIAIAFTEPLIVPSRGSLDPARDELRERLKEAERRAKALYHGGKGQPGPSHAKSRQA